MHLSLIQPRSPWGRHPYLPNGLLSVMARCRAVGVTTSLIDENLVHDLGDPVIRDQFRKADIIGVGVLGSPYIPEALRVAETLRRLGYMQPIAFGGEVVMRLSSEQFDRIFGRFGDVRHMSDEGQLGALLSVPVPSMYDTSMGPIIREMPADVKRVYFGREWCLFTSQGCAYSCNFCAATKGVKERFRHPDAFADEVDALVRDVYGVVGARAPYEVYCSSLDGCQTPDEMERTLRTVADACKRHGAFFPIRFLATATHTVRAARRDPDLLRRWRSYGLSCIGLGVDGDDPVVWRRENKRHNTSSVITEAIDLIRDAGIQPEAFMVIGFPGDDFTSLLKASCACFRLARQGIRPRPYLGKAHAPGSKGWEDGGETVERLLANPDLFRELEYAGLGSSVTHRDPVQRWASNIAFFATTMALKAVSTTGCPTQPLFPTESVPAPFRAFGRAWNSLMPQDR